MRIRFDPHEPNPQSSPPRYGACRVTGLSGWSWLSWAHQVTQHMASPMFARPPPGAAQQGYAPGSAAI